MKKIVSLILIFSLTVTSAVPTLAQGREIEDKNYYRDLFLLSSLALHKRGSYWDDSQQTNVDWVYPYVHDVFDDEIRLNRYIESLPTGFDSFANKLPRIFDFLLKADSSNPKIPPLVKYLANKTSIFDVVSEVMKIVIIKVRLGSLDEVTIEPLNEGVRSLSLVERKIPEVIKVYDELGPLATSMKKTKSWLSAVLKEAAAQKPEDYFNYIENGARQAAHIAMGVRLAELLLYTPWGLLGLAAIKDLFFKGTPNPHRRKKTPKKPPKGSNIGQRQPTPSQEVRDLLQDHIPKAPGINMNKEFMVPLVPSTVPQEVNEMETERLLEEQEQILTEEWLQDQCWVRAGAPFKKRGSRDLAFYQAVKQAMAAEGFQFDTANWEIFLNEQWELFKNSRHPPTKGTKKPRPARAARPVAPDASDDKGKKEASESSDENKESAIELCAQKFEEPVEQHGMVKVDRTEPLKTIKKGGSGSELQSPQRQAHVLIRAANNELLNLQALFARYDAIKHRDPVHDIILEDYVWYSAFQFFRAIAELHRLKGVERDFSADRRLGLIMQLTANDDDARVIRNHLMHYFVDAQVLLKFCRDILLKFIAPQVASCAMYGTGHPGALLIDLSKSELFTMQPQAINVNGMIVEQFNRIARLYAHLQKSQKKLMEEFGYLAALDNGDLTLDAAHIDYRFVDVFAARALEAELVRLGELYRRYLRQPEELKRFPHDVFAFLGQLNSDIRKKAAHEINAGNEEWHFSPLSAQYILDMVKIASQMAEAVRDSKQEKSLLDPEASVFVPSSSR